MSQANMQFRKQGANPFTNVIDTSRRATVAKWQRRVVRDVEEMEI